MRIDSIQLRVYIEGVEMPPHAIGSFSMTTRANGGTTASITMPAVFGLSSSDGMRTEYLARARVYVFWSDDAIRTSRSPNEWPLLFEGEIVGDSFHKSPSSRNVSFDLAGPEIYWDQAKLYFFNTTSAMGNPSGVAFAKKKSLFFGNSSIQISADVPGTLVVNKFLETLKKSGDAPIASAVRDIYKSCMTTNSFFDFANKSLLLDQRFVVPDDDNAAVLYADISLFYEQVLQQSSAQDGETPLSSVINDILSKFRYTKICNAQPQFVSKKKEREQQISAKVKADVEARTASWDLVVFESLGKTLTDLGVNAETTDETIEDISENDEDISLISRINTKPGTVGDDVMAKFGNIGTTDDDITEQEEIDKGRTIGILTAARDALRDIKESVRLGDKSSLYFDKAAETDVQDVFGHYLLLPDTTFSLPPTCNVIFPTESMAFSISRDWLSEPTRVMVSVPLIDDLQTFYFAPENLKGARIPQRAVVVPENWDGGFPPFIPAAGRSVESYVTSKFGVRKAPIGADLGKAKHHNGVDFGLGNGTPLYAMSDGVIIHAGRQNKDDIKRGAGYYVAYRSDLNGKKNTHEYYHMDEQLSKGMVKVGDKIKTGTQLGYSDNTGSSTGPHLHLRITEKGVSQGIDPLPFVAAVAENYRNKSDKLSTPTVPVTPEKKLEDEASVTNTDFTFTHLTKEEDIRGIVAAVDNSMDPVMSTFDLTAKAANLNKKLSSDEQGARDRYLRQYTQASFQKMKYSTRGFGAVPIPWSPKVIAGFPCLVVDRVRSVIGVVESVSHTWRASGGGEASTAVSISNPRYWDEGDPYYWVGGEEKTSTQGKVKRYPDEAVGKFPAFHLPDLVGTNSYNGDPATGSSNEPFGGSKLRKRPIDILYRSLIGVDAIPYFFKTDVNLLTGTDFSYNGAIDAFSDDGVRSKATIVGYYESLLDQSSDAAREFTHSYGDRYGASERDVLVSFLGAKTAPGGYDGGPFRPQVRAVAMKLVGVFAERQFRG
jgi:murein DD-endopeptidase MepM/ murein hydrolase activator NlpD